MKRSLLTVVLIVLLVLCTISCQRQQDTHKESNNWRDIGETISSDSIGEVSITLSMTEPSTNDMVPSEPSTSEPSTSEPLEEPTAPYSGLTEIESDLAFIYHMSNDTTFYKGDLTAVIFPASITKLWTAYVALNSVDPQIIITAEDELDFVEEDSSVAYINKGDQLTAEMLVEGMLLPSGNDAAYVLARAVGEQLVGEEDLSYEQYINAFVDEMNRLAKLAGMYNTNFVNPDGYHDDNHITTMYDVIVMARTILNSDIILKYTSLSDDTVSFLNGKTVVWKNTNLLIDPDSYFYNEAVIGLKTGYTSRAGYCLLSVLKTEKDIKIIGVFQAKTTYARFEDTKFIINCANST